MLCLSVITEPGREAPNKADGSSAISSCLLCSPAFAGPSPITLRPSRRGISIVQTEQPRARYAAAAPTASVIATTTAAAAATATAIPSEPSEKRTKKPREMGGARGPFSGIKCWRLVRLVKRIIINRPPQASTCRRGQMLFQTPVTFTGNF